MKVLSRDGREAHELLRLVDTGEWIGAIAWMANERELLVARNGRSDEERTFELWGFNLETGEGRRFRTATNGGHIRSLSVHPDLGHIAFTLATGVANEVWGLRLDRPLP